MQRYNKKIDCAKFIFLLFDDGLGYKGVIVGIRGFMDWGLVLVYVYIV